MENLNIKNIIFDLDNTIIYDTEADAESYKRVLKNNGYDENDYMAIYDAVDRYDEIIDANNCYYDKMDMLNYINQNLNKNYSEKFIDEIIDSVGSEWIKTVLVSKETIEYLFSKYNLYVFTNYYQDAQKQRIENIGYSKYFKKVFGADKYGCKQYKESFERVLSEIGAKPEECIMIGDDKTRDIVAANNMNMKSILYDYNGKRDKKDVDVKDYIIIKDMKELENIL